MIPIKVEWTPAFNILYIKCNCRLIFTSYVNKWRVQCPKCGRTESTNLLRKILVKRWVDKHGKKEKNYKRGKR